MTKDEERGSSIQLTGLSILKIKKRVKYELTPVLGLRNLLTFEIYTSDLSYAQWHVNNAELIPIFFFHLLYILKRRFLWSKVWSFRREKGLEPKLVPHFNWVRQTSYPGKKAAHFSTYQEEIMKTFFKSVFSYSWNFIRTLEINGVAWVLVIDL